MTDQHVAAPLGLYTRRSGSAAPDRPSRASEETGESSNRASLQAPSIDGALAYSDDEALSRDRGRDRDRDHEGRRTASRDGRAPRTHRPRPSGAFLLQDAVAGDGDFGRQRRQSRRPPQYKGKAALEGRSPSSNRHVRSSLDSAHGLQQPSPAPEGSHEELLMRKRGRSSQEDSKSLPSPPRPSGFDVDSTQIVNMALNLSESRRIASRRAASRANPPRLTPLPDATPGGNLRGHLQQQRKTSRNISPRPHSSLTARLPSNLRSHSPFQAPFEPSHDNTYRYHFSTSTLSRAQKAKEHLEIMAQYRRLLDILPPLKPDCDRPTSPSNHRLVKYGTAESSTATGREYNPLQYIRNRKVRARERRAIDGERQGFGDVDSVRLWVDEALRHVSTTEMVPFEGESILPPFPGAEEADAQASPDASGKTALRLRRPRVDWFFEPCDMVADAYWLEQDHHKQLIEDRQWCKIFPQNAALSRPMSQQTDDNNTGVAPFITKNRDDAEGFVDPKDLKLIRPGTENSQSSAKERAKQKLHDIKGLHKQAASTHNHHDFLRLKRDSSDLSGSDNEDKKEGKSRKTRPGRAGTLSSNTNDLLQKQMLEMIAQEAREQQPVITDQPISETPEDMSKPSSRLHSRKGSLADISDSDHTSIRDKASQEFYRPIHQHGKLKVDIPGRLRPESIDVDSSLPTSPELYKPATAADISTSSSRSSSPSRNPFSKVKQIFRDMSRDDVIETQVAEVEDDDRRRSFQEPLSPAESKRSVELRQPASRLSIETSKPHRSSASARVKGEDQVGLRGMFKSPRLDTVLRGGVSRLGEMLWKKDSSNDNPELPSAENSDSEPPRGRPRISLTLSRTESKRHRNESQQPAKHFLDSMPQFQHASERQNKSSTSDEQKLGSELLRPQSQQSPRFDRLKPPAIDVQRASESSPHSTSHIQKVDPEMSDAESYEGKAPSVIRGTDKRLSTVMAMPRFDDRSRSQSRHWSIVDSVPPPRSQLSKREIARMRALILTSGIKAMEISRRAHLPHKPLSGGSIKTAPELRRTSVVGVPWAEISRLGPDESFPGDQQVAYCDHYPLASQTLGIAIQSAVQQWKASADCFTTQTSPNLHKKIGFVRSRIADDLSNMTREAADQADETGKDLAVGQRLKVKHVDDVIEKMIRNRRRRFRWVRRGMWLVVEWLLVGFMWYVWFIVMILRIFLGVGKGVWTGVKWLLWL